MASYYRKIKGKNYDLELLELAEKLTAGQGDGRISKADAAKMFERVADAGKYTEIEKRTMEYIRETFSFTPEADKWLRGRIRSWADAKVKDSSTGRQDSSSRSKASKITSSKQKRTRVSKSKQNTGTQKRSGAKTEKSAKPDMAASAATQKRKADLQPAVQGDDRSQENSVAVDSAQWKDPAVKLEEERVAKGYYQRFSLWWKVAAIILVLFAAVYFIIYYAGSGSSKSDSFGNKTSLNSVGDSRQDSDDSNAKSKIDPNNEKINFKEKKSLSKENVKAETSDNDAAFKKKAGPVTKNSKSAQKKIYPLSKQDRQIYFSFNSARLTKIGEGKLRKVVRLMQENPQSRLLISSYTCNIGPQWANDRTALRRAQAVEKYLQDNGIGRQRLERKVYGERKARYSNKSLEGRRRNRSVVLNLEN